MKVAVEGCCHGELDNIYSHIAELEAKNRYKVDLLLICGDFQAVRNHQDLQCMAVPDKYKHLQTFYKYYTENKKAPILTIVIGGNHEASNYMWELYHGGWLAPNIYFLGHAGSVLVNGVKISGASGIFKAYNFSRGYFETQPYDKEAIRSIYHIREFNVRKLSLLSSPQIFLSHDWPLDIDKHGDTRALIRQKAHFRAEINRNELGSPPLMGLLRNLKPEWWFSAHLHVRFEATVVHSSGGIAQEPVGVPQEKVANPDEIAISDDDLDSASAAVSAPASAAKPVEDGHLTSQVSNNPDEIKLDDEEEDVTAPPVVTSSMPPSITHFIALDKCLPRRKFLEVVDITVDSDSSPSPNPPTLAFDPEWLAITRAFQPWFSLQKHQKPFPDEEQAREIVQRELEWVNENLLKGKEVLPISDVQQFVKTAPGPGSEGANKFKQPPAYSNPQTENYCKLLQIENAINPGKPQS